MPHKTKKPCAFPGCPNLTGERYCADHIVLEQRRYNQHTRDPDTYKAYGRRWRKIRSLYLAKHPLCEMCLESGRYIPAQEVHHKKPIADGGTHDESNLQALCKPCHSSITLTATNQTR